MHRSSIHQEIAFAKQATDTPEGCGVGMARVSIVPVGPEECGEFIAQMRLLAVQDQIGKERLCLARSKRRQWRIVEAKFWAAKKIDGQAGVAGLFAVNTNHFTLPHC